MRGGLTTPFTAAHTAEAHTSCTSGRPRYGVRMRPSRGRHCDVGHAQDGAAPPQPLRPLPGRAPQHRQRRAHRFAQRRTSREGGATISRAQPRQPTVSQVNPWPCPSRRGTAARGVGRGPGPWPGLAARWRSVFGARARRRVTEIRGVIGGEAL